jgi:hypothetical protein
MSLNDLLYLLLLCCVVPTVLVTGLMVWGLLYARKALVPSEAALQDRFRQLQASGKRGDDLIDHIIQQQAVRAGIVGAVTSVGGLVVLPFGLVIDLYASTRLQETTLRLIAWANGLRTEEETLSYAEFLSRKEGYIDPTLVATTSTAVTRRLVQRLLREVGEKAFAKLIPGLGLLIGYAVNYYSLRGVASVARRYYTRTP